MALSDISPHVKTDFHDCCLHDDSVCKSDLPCAVFFWGGVQNIMLPTAKIWLPAISAF